MTNQPSEERCATCGGLGYVIVPGHAGDRSCKEGDCRNCPEPQQDQCPDCTPAPSEALVREPVIAELRVPKDAAADEPKPGEKCAECGCAAMYHRDVSKGKSYCCGCPKFTPADAMHVPAPPVKDDEFDAWKRGVVEFAAISGDPDAFGTDAYNFLDKPHRFIRELYARRSAAPLDVRKAAERIAGELFVNGFGDKADRLVLTSPDGADLGGWSRNAAIDKIAVKLSVIMEGK